jgi:hypothetical protein
LFYGALVSKARLLSSDGWLVSYLVIHYLLK